VSRDLLFEIGVEELPSTYVAPALGQMEREMADGLETLRLSHGAVRSFGTPRRLTVAIEDVAERQTDFDEEAMGPATRVAFDAEGKPTRALLGFCAGKGVDPSAARRVATAKGEYVAVTVHHQGQPAGAVIPAMLGDVARRLAFPKRMRWLPLQPGADARADAGWFARPVRWLLALLGDKELPVAAFGLSAGHESFGHRFLAPARIKVKRAGDYAETLEKAHVIADPARRRALIEEEAAAQAARAGGRVVKDDELVDINTFMVEWPTVFAGRFDPHYLDLPREVIVTALREHQRFFAVERDNGDLLPAFLAVRNGDDRGIEQVIRGNEDVLIARLEDARFYWKTDLEKTPEQRVEDLAGVVWIEGLGSLREKAVRLESLGEWLAARLAPSVTATVRRAARLIASSRSRSRAKRAMASAKPAMSPTGGR
jgi:glycyl-tRNA synthetase beta chain